MAEKRQNLPKQETPLKTNAVKNGEKTTPKRPHFLTVEPDNADDSDLRDSYVFQAGLDTMHVNAELPHEVIGTVSGQNESPQNNNENSALKQKSQRSTVISHMFQRQGGSPAQKGQQPQNSSAMETHGREIADQNQRMQNRTMPVHGDPIVASAPNIKALQQNMQDSSSTRPPVASQNHAAKKSSNQLPQMRQPRASQNNVIPPAGDNGGLPPGDISQTIFSSYNDSDSVQTLRFNRHVSRMSMTAEMAEHGGVTIGPRGDNGQQQTYDQQHRAHKASHAGRRQKPAVIKKPTNLEVKTTRLEPVPTPVYTSDGKMDNQELQRQQMSQMQPGATERYQSLRQVNLGEMAAGGEIPLATEVDISGKPITKDGLKETEERTKQLKVAMATLKSGQRSPLLSKSPRAGSFDLEHTSLNHAVQGKSIKLSVEDAYNDGSGGATSRNIKLLNQEGSGGRKSPFQSLSNIVTPVLTVINKNAEISGQKDSIRVKRKHQSPSKYNIEGLPSHLNKTYSKEKLEKIDEPVSPKKNAAAKLHKTAKDNKTSDSNQQSPKSSSIPTNLNSAINALSKEHLHLDEDMIEEPKRQAYATSKQQQFATVAVSPMISGSEIMRYDNLATMFSNSSEDPNNTASQMMQSGMSSNQRRKPLFKDASSHISKNETFRSMTTERKTTKQNRFADETFQESQQMNENKIVIRRNKGQYLTPLRVRNPQPADDKLLDQDQKAATARASSTIRASQLTKVQSSHMNTLERAADRNMFGKMPPEISHRPSRNVHFAKARSSEPTLLAREKEPYRPNFPPLKPSEQRTVPKPLYYTNGYMPKLSDLRDAIRNNSMFHNRYNPHLDDKEFRFVVNTALKRQPGEEKGKVNEEFEDQPLLDLLIPVFQQMDDNHKEKVEKERNYQAVLHTRTQQKKTMNKLINLKAEHFAKLEAIRKDELAEVKRKANTFKAKQNPLVNHDTAESIQKFLSLEQRDPKRALLFNFIAEKRDQDIILPQSLFMAPPEQKKRIEKFIAEENRKMQAQDNDNQKFDRLKRKVEDLVEQGFTFKQPEKKKVTFDQGDKYSTGAEYQTSEHNMTSLTRKQSLSPSMASLSIRSMVSKRLLDPAIVNNDMEYPAMTEVRMRPAPDFVPMKAHRPKALKTYKKKSPAQAQTPSKLKVKTVERQRSSGADIVDVINQGTFEAIPEQVDMLLDTMSIQMSDKGIQDLRKSREQLRNTPGFVQTHAQALRQSKERPLEFQKSRDEGDLTATVIEEKASSNSLRESKSFVDLKKTQGEHQGENHGEKKSLLQEDVRKSLLRDNSAILPPPSKPGDNLLPPFNVAKHDEITTSEIDIAPQVTGDAAGQSQQFIMINSNSVDELGGTSPSNDTRVVNNEKQINATQPFMLSQQMSQNQFTIQPSMLTNTTLIKGMAREKLIAEKKIEMLHKPELNKSSCNHCINKAVQKYGKVTEQLSYTSTISQSPTKASLFNQATTEFLSVNPSEGHLANNFSMSQIHTTQYESQSNNFTSEASNKRAMAHLAKNANEAIKGLIAQCDSHYKISKFTNEEFSNDLKKAHKAAINEVNSIKGVIHSILEAQEEVPSWEEVRELQSMEKASDKDIIDSMVELKKNIDPEKLIYIIKWDMANRSQFKPSALKIDPEVERFLKQRFEKGTD